MQLGSLLQSVLIEPASHGLTSEVPVNLAVQQWIKALRPLFLMVMRCLHWMWTAVKRSDERVAFAILREKVEGGPPYDPTNWC